MDQAIRNKLRNVVTQCRRLLEEAVAQVLQGQFGIYASGKKDEVHVEDEARMKNLSEEDKGYRRDIQAHLGHIQALGYKPKDALAQLVREIAFTHLNRLCAYKMMEAREVWVGGQRFREAVSRGLKSQGFQFYLADHPEDKQRFDTGHQDVAYRHFLGWLGALLSEEIGVLFSPTDSANRLFPPQRVLDEVLGLLNGDDLKGIWTEDETIGWVYQYFTPKELRDQARKESAAPRNSYELAFRNQFFTPRYVVEFLTDNTLGRIWYEMRKGDTKLKDQCSYMVRRPNEVFLSEGQSPPEPAQNQDELPQKDLLKQPVHILHRLKKDPRELRILDPACGSGHFLLYCFDLLLTIYEEAYADPDLGPKLKENYPTHDALLRDVPRLILAHNLHGIDIDLRATQIAALALWLRCQREYREMGLKQDRPRITKSNIVCAEPMPGELEMLDEFLKSLKQDRLEALIRRVMQVPEGTRVRATESMVESLCDLVRLVWSKMQLAGEAGSLLKIEEELQEAVRKGQEEWEQKQPLFRFTEFSLTEKPKETYVRYVPGEGVSFWERAEALVLEALQDYARHAANGGRLQRQLFADDAAQGFAFIDICQKRFDVVLMNPPFGLPSAASKDYIFSSFPTTKNDVYAVFVQRGISSLQSNGILGAITSRTGFFLTSFQGWREEILLPLTRLAAFADFGMGVLDSAMVETAAYCLAQGSNDAASVFFRLLRCEDKAAALLSATQGTRRGNTPDRVFLTSQESFRQIPGSPFAYWIGTTIRRLFTEFPPFENEDEGRSTRCGLGTTDNFRFLRLFWEVPESKRHEWVTYYDGGVYSPIYDRFPLVVFWANKGEQIKKFVEEKMGSASRNVRGEDYYFVPGFVFPRRTRGLSPKIMAAGGIFSVGGQAGFVPLPDLEWTIGMLSSRLITFLVSLSQGRTGDAAQFEVGQIKRLPWVTSLKEADKIELARATRAVCDSKRATFSGDEVTQGFVRPSLLRVNGETLDARMSETTNCGSRSVRCIEECRQKIDSIAFDVYGIDSKARQAIEEENESPANVEPDTATGSDDTTSDNGEPLEAVANPRILLGELLSYAVGCVFGRWDIRFGTGERDSPGLPDPFLAYPVCSPGRLQGEDGLPVTEPPTGYALHIEWGGVIPDDPDRPDDIVRRVREILELIWTGRAEAMEKEACEVLGVKELRDFFRKPGKGGFWDEHVARYSKSRRKAPIYWLLQSSKKNYALWLYYHRLDKDILFKARQNYVEPKMRLEQTRLDSLRSQKAALGAGAKGAKKIDKDMERQESLLVELKDFAEKLERAAKLNFGDPAKLDSEVVYDPDLNDGVLLNIAPLWELVPWKEAKAYWEELLEGQYEWSSMGKLLRKKGLVK